MSDFLEPGDIARHLHVSVKRIRELLRGGKIAGSKPTGTWKVFRQPFCRGLECVPDQRCNVTESKYCAFLRK
jgi:hypothetical protein